MSLDLFDGMGFSRVSILEENGIQRWTVLGSTSGKRAFGQDPLVPAVIWAGTKGLATSPQIRQPARQPIVPVRYKPLVLVWDTNQD
jgi:hypothetical protein